jgi:hypothetical protein
MSTAERFEFAFDPTYRSLARAFAITPQKAWVEVSDTKFYARFGPFRLATPLSNIAGVAITGPYAMFKTAGPARLGITDGSLTFASNGDRGVLLRFATPVGGKGRLGLLRHPELTVTVADPERLAALLDARRGGAEGPAAEPPR